MLHKNSFMKFFLAICVLLIFTSQSQATLYMGISGKAFDADTKTGVGRVKLVLVSTFDGKLVSEVSSATDGSFFFKRVPSGMYNILAIQSDSFFIPSEKPVSVTVPRGKNVIGVSVPVHKGGVIKGRIITSQGQAIPGARITDGKLVSTVSDHNGYFFLRGIPAGELKIAVMSSGLGVKAVKTISEKNKTTDLGNITFSVSLENTLRGKVVNTDNKPIPNAILVVHNDSNDNYSAGFTIASDNGEFIITGLNPGKHKLLVVSNGYNVLEIPEIAVPANQIFTLTPSATQTAGISNSVTNDSFDVSDSIFSKMLTFITPSVSYAARCPKSCPDGKWSGAVVDVSVLAMLPIFGPGKDVGGTMTIGTLGCWTAPSKIQISTFCATAGIGNILASLSMGVSGMYCWSACCGHDLTGTTWGITGSYSKLAGGNRAVVGGAGIEFGSGAICGAVNVGIGSSWPNWTEPLGAPDAYVGGRLCETNELVNVFEYWAKVLGM